MPSDFNAIIKGLVNSQKEFDNRIRQLQQNQNQLTVLIA